MGFIIYVDVIYMLIIVWKRGVGSNGYLCYEVFIILFEIVILSGLWKVKDVL